MEKDIHRQEEITQTAWHRAAEAHAKVRNRLKDWFGNIQE